MVVGWLVNSTKDDACKIVTVSRLSDSTLSFSTNASSDPLKSIFIILTQFLILYYVHRRLLISKGGTFLTVQGLSSNFAFVDGFLTETVAPTSFTHGF